MFLPYNATIKAMFIVQCAHAQALYSCEASPRDANLMNKYSAKVANTICHAPHRSQRVTMMLSHGGMNIDPYAYVFNKRAQGIRRIIDKYPHTLPLVQNICKEYQGKQHPGIYVDDARLAELCPIPPPGSHDRTQIPNECKTYGPIEHFFVQLFEQASQLNHSTLDIYIYI